MKEEKIDAVPFVADPQALLTGHKGEIVPQLEQEVFEVKNQRIFEVGFRVFILQSEELEDEWIANFVFGRHSVFGLGGC